MSDKLHDRLMNWARWAKFGAEIGTCGSAEKFYRAPWRQWTPLSEIGVGDHIDILDAERVECAWKLLNSKDRLILKFHYIRKMPVHFICQRVRIKLWHFDASFGRAHYHMRKMLDTVDSECYKATKFDLLRESVDA